MDHVTYENILHTIAWQRPETGGILLGPIGNDNEITSWFFDRGLNCTAATYSPDYMTLRRKMKEEWMPFGIDMKGFVHSHPGHYDRLSAGDLVYVNRLLDKNEDMSMFAAPIVIPTQFRIRPIVVLREKPRRAQEAKLILF